MPTSAPVQDWLRQRGAETVDHPGGTLYAHLCRVHDRLRGLGLGVDVQLAGLTHAAYGTDGFDVVLLDRADRETLRALIGETAERLVYRYGACDRRRSWRHLADTRQVVDRFTGEVQTLGAAELRSFVDLCIVNELDVVEQSPAIAERHGPYLRTLFASWASLASPPVNAEARRVLAAR
ncbi:DUF6817 domain-containing protein [Micromonospora sp. WMMD1082]|uniref:DUF6817 domain-containing protein n=1 Tax=Micromonospora sp. WMMD1082 TaxID=3016104 RepID=UPI002417350B|nr:hypothetical protein [Micromonospora sp. WMMD1082]MDG4797733.1 hypothetical protein [Micromonospora sp. WMMD1082]